MRIGEILVQQSLLTEAQLDAALRTQALYGGRLASVIVELGYVDADLATRALSRQKRVPAALQKHFDNVDAKALARVNARVAERLLSIPLGFTGESGTSVIVALAEPSDLRVLEELRFALGMPVIPGVALENRIRRALERHYGVPRRSNRGFIPVAHADPELSPMPSGHVFTPQVRQTGSQPRVPKIAPPDLTLDAPPPSRVPASLPPFRQASVQPPPTSHAPISYAPGTPPPPSRPRTFSPPLPREEPLQSPASRSSQRLLTRETDRSPLDADGARAALLLATNLEGRAEVIVRYLRSSFEAAAVFVPRNDIAFGWKASSPSVPGPAAPSIAVPLTKPSLFTLPYEARAAFTGAPPPEGAEIHARIWAALKTLPPRQVLAMPLVIDGQVAALIYAHPRPGEGVPSSAVVELTSICADVARRASTRPR